MDESVRMCFWTRFFWLGLICWGFPFNIFAQITGPEQDCFSALPLCSNSFTQPQTYNGTGSILDIQQLVTSNNICLRFGENNSVWYIFTTQTAGQLLFTLNPVNASNDYDFALFNLTQRSCADIFSGTLPPVRCSFSQIQGSTGLAPGAIDTVQGPAANPPFLAPLSVSAGQTFVLLIDNFAINGQGYTLDFTGSTATLLNTSFPTPLRIENVGCSANDSIVLVMSEPIRCNSIAANGSDFTLQGPGAVPIISAQGEGCTLGGITQRIVIRLATPIVTAGNYSLIIQNGSDGNTLSDLCNNFIPTLPQPQLIPFSVPNRVRANFNFNISNACERDTFRFNDLSQGNINQWEWNFGDGSPPSNQQNPSHFFLSNSTYPVRLVVSNADCADTLIQNIPVTNSFSANFTYSPQIICPGDTVRFLDASSPGATNWAWFFGDGGIAGGQSNATHVYQSGGTYDVRLLISGGNNNNCRDSIIIPIEVNARPSADFIPNPFEICQNQSIRFNDNSLGTPIQWSWDFGDGTTSNIQSPTHQYAFTGSIQVTLQIDDAFCGNDQVSRTINVLPGPIVNLGNDTLICAGDELLLTAASGNNLRYRWSTGDTSRLLSFRGVNQSVSLEVFQGQCIGRDTLFVGEQLEGCFFILLPNAFSPNGDGANEILRLRADRLERYVWRIYNRFGNLVFESANNLLQGWDGTYKAEPASPGVYHYIVDYKTEGGKVGIMKGNITLIR